MSCGAQCHAYEPEIVLSTLAMHATKCTVLPLSRCAATWANWDDNDFQQTGCLSPLNAMTAALTAPCRALRRMDC